jgi:hypothetical protein
LTTEEDRPIMFRRHSRTALAALAAAASLFVVSTAPPAGAAPDRPAVGSGTPMCLVGAALLYPLFVTNVLLADPIDMPTAAPGYWTGGETGGHDAGSGDQFHGWLPACGVQPG